jgi:hypothetical protein
MRSQLCACEEWERRKEKAEESAATTVDAQHKQAFRTDFHNLLERAARGCRNSASATTADGLISPKILDSVFSEAYPRSTGHMFIWVLNGKKSSSTKFSRIFK